MGTNGEIFAPRRPFFTFCFVCAAGWWVGGCPLHLSPRLSKGLGPAHSTGAPLDASHSFTSAVHSLVLLHENGCGQEEGLLTVGAVLPPRPGRPHPKTSTQTQESGSLQRRLVSRHIALLVFKCHADEDFLLENAPFNQNTTGGYFKGTGGASRPNLRLEAPSTQPRVGCTWGDIGGVWGESRGEVCGACGCGASMVTHAAPHVRGPSGVAPLCHGPGKTPLARQSQDTAHAGGRTTTPGRTTAAGP